MPKPANKLFNKALGANHPLAQTENAAAAADAQPAEPTDFPCSVAQERFWLLDRLDPGNASFNVAVRWRLEGRISTDLLEQAWHTIIERHEILRTIFRDVDGVPIQRVMRHSPFKLAEIDLSNLPQDRQQSEGERIGIIEARAPFDLGAGPLIRATLLRFSPTVAILLVTTHQIVSDGWSIGIMAREMGVIYDALRHDKPLALDALTIQYADYSMWQLEWLRVRGTEAEEAYWTKQLAGVRPFRVIPDRARHGMPTTNGAIVSTVLARELTNRAQTLSGERGATLFATALAALCVTLARFTDEEEIVIGTQVSDRDQIELESMIGQFVNSLILRNSVAGNPRFGELVDRVRETAAQALEHRHIPIERLLGMVKGERSHADSPPISVNFIFQKTFIQNTAYTDFALIDMPSLPAGAIYDLNFFMVERPDGWRFSCQYNTDQFEGETADRLLKYFQYALESAVADPECRVSDLALSAPSETKILLGKLNDTRALYPRDLTLAKLFEAQAMRLPDSIAVVCDERQVTYAELNASAERLAQHLRERGIKPRSRVGVCLDRSIELPIALLAILKAGATYVPMDPADPPAYRSWQIETSQAAAVIVQNGEHTTGDSSRQVVRVESQAAPANATPAANPDPGVALEADAAACLTFKCSGATELPAVGMSHRNLANLVYSMAKRPGVADRDVLVATAPVTLDRATVEVFLPLLTGARLVLAQNKDLANGRRLLHLLQRSGATIMQATRQTWSMLVESGWIGFPALKMFCSGTDLSPRLIDELLPMGGELWALCGHSEASIWSSARRVKSKQGITAVGEPIANTALYVLDGKQRAAPIGATGAIFIGGDGLTESFPGQSAAAGEEFIADPFTNSPGAKLYRTGDRGRLKASGQIEYLGRSDYKFYWRGRLVDPAGIESVMLRHPDVAEAAVVHVGAATAGGGSIAAYVALRTAPSTSTDAILAQLRERLSALLPDYLIPSFILVRDSLPRFPGGGVDRRSLQASKALTPRSREPTQPANEIERRLAAMWLSMLGLESIETTDNFFEMGGHSLLAARMLTRLQSVFGRRVKLATLFAAPTIRELAKILSQPDPREFDFRQMVKVQPQGSKPPLIGINNTGIYYGLARCLGEDQPVTSLQLFDPSVKTATLPFTLEEIAAGYVELIRRVQPNGPYELMGWCVAGALAFEIARQLREANHEVSHLFLIDSWVPGYAKRLPRIRGLIADYSLRWQLIVADWFRFVTGEQSLADFISNRMIAKKLKLHFGRSRKNDGRTSDGEYASPENYDQWLLAYLQKLTARYEPKMYPGRVTLLRSRQEPTGWFFDSAAGWGSFTSDGVDVFLVDGNHFTMFKDPGVAQMARHISARLDAYAARAQQEPV
jgi:amino acid adenylation domain-containing protein